MLKPQTYDLNEQLNIIIFTFWGIYLTEKKWDREREIERRTKDMESTYW